MQPAQQPGAGLNRDSLPTIRAGHGVANLKRAVAHGFKPQLAHHQPLHPQDNQGVNGAILNGDPTRRVEDILASPPLADPGVQDRFQRRPTVRGRAHQRGGHKLKAQARCVKRRHHPGEWGASAALTSIAPLPRQSLRAECARARSASKSDDPFMTEELHVVAVGNAIVDILHQVDDAFLDRHQIIKGAMQLIEEERALYLTEYFSDATVQAGGSAANSMTGIASLGGRAGFIGKVADDALGDQFTAKFRQDGVAFDTPARRGPPGTARCIIAVTGDGQRSMNTYLGASTLLEPSDIDQALIARAQICFLEGYLFDRDEAKAAFVRAAEYARAAGRCVSITLSDTFCVERHRDSFRHLVAHHIDILFANEHEILSLYQTDNLTEALNRARMDCPLAAVTRSEKGCVVVAGDQTIEVPAAPVAKVVDTTGAGDLFAAGFLFGQATGRSLHDCARLGALAAAEVISHMGPRPEAPLALLAKAQGL